MLDAVAIVTAPPSLSLSAGGIFFPLRSCMMNKMCVFSVLNYESVSVISCENVCE